MNRYAVVAAALVAVAVLLGGGSLAATDGQGNATEVAPGTAAAGVIGTQGATLDRAVSVADYRSRVTAAESPAEKARVIGDTLDDTATRLDALEGRLARLRAARANGSMTEDGYAVRVAPVAAQARSLDALLGWVQDEARTLDAATLREAGVTRDRLDDLDNRAERVADAGRGALGGGGLDGDFYRTVATVAGAYNERADRRDLGLLGSHLDGERVNLHVDRTDGGTEVLSFRMTEDRRVRALRAGPHPDATLRLEVDESTARRVLDAEDPVTAASEAFLDGEIEIDGLGLYNAIKWTVLNVVLGVLRALAGLVDAIRSLQL